MLESFFEITEGGGAIVAAAIHDGHEVRNEVAEQFAISEEGRLREEDPHTGGWTEVAENRIVCRRSRFEFDLNRSRDKAVYIEPEDAWGLTVWKNKPSPEIVRDSLERYDAFYAGAFRALKKLEKQYNRFVVLDLHNYNHRREGPDAPPADPAENPEVNVGTGSMNREKWTPVVDRFMKDLRSFDYLGRNLDVRENVKFKGGHFSQWIHKNFPESGCSLAIEFKKFFMDEWTGAAYPDRVRAIRDALQSTIPGLVEVLNR